MFITVIQTTASELILSRFQARRGKVTFLKGVRQLLDAEETPVSATLAEWQKDCQEDRIILALPAAFFSLREVPLPLSDRKKGREILPLELKGEMASDANEPLFDALPLDGGKTAAIWAGRSQLEVAIKPFIEAGLEPEIVTSAMFSFGALLPGGATDAAVIVDGDGLALFAEGKPLFFRAMPKSGGCQLKATLAALNFAKGIEIGRVYSIAGSEAIFSAPVEPLPLEGVISESFSGDTSAATDLAAHYAIAQTAATGEPVNLRRGAFAFTRHSSRLQKKLRLTWLLAATLLLLIFGEAAVRYFMVKRNLTSLDGSIRQIYKEVFPSRAKAVDEVSELKAEIRKLGASGSDGVLSVLTQLANAKGDEPRELYEVEIEGGQFSGRGYDRSAQSVNEFKAKAAPLFAAFEVSEIKSRPDGSVSFAFRGSLKGGGK